MRASRRTYSRSRLASNVNGNMTSLLGAFAAAWGIAGWSAVLFFAIVRLSRIAAEALAMDLTGVQFAVLLANAALLAWTEGYRGFQLKFSPRAAARVLYLSRHADWRSALLAPFFCVGFYRATARIRRLTWTGTVLIIALIVVVHRLPQPWRGIVDVGVVLGLSWGLITFLAMSARALASGAFPTSPEVPETATTGRGL